jgi:hypothetical protein
MNPPPIRAPNASELLSHLGVIQAMDEAWNDSQVDEPDNRHEEGGWIYMDLTTAAIVTRRAPRGTRSRLSLANPPLLPNHLIVGTFHTHPHPAAEGWATEPSTQDTTAAIHTGVPWLIRAEDGDYHTGPDSRRGGLGGDAGYPT